MTDSPFSIKELNSTEDKAVLREIIYKIVMQVVIGEAQSDIVVSTLYQIIVSPFKL